MYIRGNLRQLLFLLLFYVFSWTISAQNAQDQIKREFENYLQYLLEKDFDKALDYMPTEVFDIVPKSVLLNAMDQVFNNPEMEIEILNPQIDSIGQSVQIDQKFYAPLFYTSQLRMRFLDLMDLEADMRTTQLNITKLALENEFGVDNVLLKDDEFLMNSGNKVYAISLDGISNWKFIVMEKGREFILKKILPEQLIDGE